MSSSLVRAAKAVGTRVHSIASTISHDNILRFIIFSSFPSYLIVILPGGSFHQ